MKQHLFAAHRAVDCLTHVLVPAEVGFLNQFLLYKITKYLQSWPLLTIKKEHKSTLQEILINNLIHHSSRIHIDMKYVTKTHEEE